MTRINRDGFSSEVKACSLNLRCMDAGVDILSSSFFKPDERKPLSAKVGDEIHGFHLDMSSPMTPFSWRPQRVRHNQKAYYIKSWNLVLRVLSACFLFFVLFHCYSGMEKNNCLFSRCHRIQGYGTGTGGQGAVRLNCAWRYHETSWNRYVFPYRQINWEIAWWLPDSCQWYTFSM